MPYRMRRVPGQADGDEWCIFVAGESDPVKCHPSKSMALAHLRALGANVEEAMLAPDDDEAGHFIERGFYVDLFADDDGVASRALAGEPICILPLGTFWRGGREKVITPDVVDQFVENWHEREVRGIRRKRLAVDADHDGRARGWYRDVMPLDQGLGATFRWTRRGRQALEDGEFAYFSPTVYWRVTDRVTNEVVENQLGGGALTNYPFFGEETALFSLRGQALDGPPMYYAVTKTDGGVEYPARAYLVAVDPTKPTTWHLRVYTWRESKLVPDHGRMGIVHTALTSPGGQRADVYGGPQKIEATRKLKEIYASEGMDFNLGGGSTMTEQDLTGGDGTGVVREFFAQLRALLPSGSTDQGSTGSEELQALQTRLEEMSTRLEALSGLEQTVTVLQGERDAFATQVEGLQGRLSVEEGLRRAAQYASMVASDFSHIPGEAPALAAELSWLHTVDLTEGQPHAAFFTALLRSADAQFADAFDARGTIIPATTGVMAQIDGLARQYMADHEGVVHMDAISAVLAANPKLYEAYTQDVVGGDQ